VGAIFSFIRFPFSYLFCVSLTLIMCIPIIILPFKKLKPFWYYYVRIWAQCLCWAMGMKLIVKGLENLPKGTGVYVFNHLSLVDSLVIFATVPRRVYFGAKIELFKIPVLGTAIKNLDFLPVSRSNTPASIRFLNNARTRLIAGDSFVLSPEGTRQSNGEIGTFKNGPFFLAINAKVPIIPVVLNNTEKIMPNKTVWINPGVWTRKISVHILKPVESSQFDFRDRHLMRNLVRFKMEKVFLLNKNHESENFVDQLISLKD